MNIEEVRAAFERLHKVFRQIVSCIHRVAKEIVASFKREWVKYIIQNGSHQQQIRARIYMRTKNSRIKRKQWKAIFVIFKL